MALIGRKVGMTQVFQEDGTRVPVTVFGVASTTVTGTRVPSSWKTWVMPTFLPTIAATPPQILISMSTPAGSASRRCSESIVFGVG